MSKRARVTMGINERIINKKEGRGGSRDERDMP
jgi:hypothetical protein